MNKRVRIKDIAELAGVSIGTVDRVLHNRGEVNAKTRRMILELVKHLNYTPNLVAKSLSLKKGFRIALLLPEGGTVNPYWKKPLEGIQQALEELKDYNTEIELYNFDSGQEKSFDEKFDLMISQKPDGIIFAPHFTECSEKKVAACEELKIPYIFIDTFLENESGLGFFGQDAFQGGMVAAKLIHYGQPRSTKILILHLGKNKAITSHMQMREQGFLFYFKSHVKEMDLDIVTLVLDLSLSSEPDQSLLEFLSSNPDVNGIFVTNSRAHKVASCLSNNGHKKIILAGYDLIDENMVFLNNGFIDFLICQKPEQQGYKSIIAMFNYLLTGKMPDRINHSPIDIVIKENCNCYKISKSFQ